MEVLHQLWCHAETGGSKQRYIIKGGVGEHRTSGWPVPAGQKGWEEFFSSEDKIYSFRFWFFS